MTWTQERIRAEHDRLTQRWDDINTELTALRAAMRVLHSRCKHPDAYPYSTMGDMGRKCPDCGWAT